MADVGAVESGRSGRRSSAETDNQLQRGALGLSGVLMQALTNIAPAIAVLFTVPFIASNAGIAAPAAYLGAFLLSAATAIVLTQLAKHLPSAGTYYTYVSRGLHPRAGFLVAWLYFLFAPIVTAQVGTSIGSTFESTLKAEYSFTFPWWLFTLLLIGFVGFMVARGIKVSVRAIVVLGCVELVIVAVFSLWGFFDPGPGGISLSAFNPGEAPSGSNTGFALAIIFAIFALTGWDAAAPVAEESENPRRVVPRAVLMAVTFMGFFLVICSWGIVTGWGVDRIDKFTSSEEAPYIILAKQYFGGAGVPIILVALLNSALAVVISAANVATRLWYAMARSGALPAALAKVHPRWRTPVNAVILQTVVSLIVGVGTAALIGEDKVYNVTGLIFTFVLIPVYVMGNLACFLLYRREHPGEFNPFVHIVIPIISTAGLIAVGYKSLSPAPAYPNNYAFPIVAVWAVIGAVILIGMRLARREEWLLRAGESIVDRPVEEPARV